MRCCNNYHYFTLNGTNSRHLQVPKTNSILNFNNFSTTRPISVFKELLNRGFQFVSRVNLLRVTPRTDFFLIYVKKIWFLMFIILFWDTKIIASVLPSGGTIGASRVLKIKHMINFNNISTTRPILDLKVLMNRAR